jgi:hypothetical protein
LPPLGSRMRAAHRHGTRRRARCSRGIPQRHGAPKYLPPIDTDRALRATIRHGIRQYSWSIISVITAELPSCERCGLASEIRPSIRIIIAGYPSQADMNVVVLGVTGRTDVIATRI